MAGEAQDTVGPLLEFSFSVAVDGKVMSFQEVSGLDVEPQIVEYRVGDSKSFSTIQMPGMQKSGNVTLKKGVFAKDDAFYTWFDQTRLNSIKRSTVVISLLDQTGAATMVWTLSNAWPTKITGTDLKADGNEVAVETIELAHDGLAIQNG